MKDGLDTNPRISLYTSSFEWREFISVLASVLFLLLLLIVVRNGWSKLSQQRRLISELKKTEAILVEKKGKLEKVDKDLVPVFLDNSFNFLPIERPVVSAISEIKNLLAGYLISADAIDVSLVSVDSVTDDSVVADLITIGISGTFDQIDLFLKKIENIVPIMSVKSLNLSLEDGFLQGEVQILSFWSPYKLPSSIKADSPLPEITDAEKINLDKLSSYEKSGSYREIYPTGPYTRSNPFLNE